MTTENLDSHYIVNQGIEVWGPYTIADANRNAVVLEQRLATKRLSVHEQFEGPSNPLAAKFREIALARPIHVIVTTKKPDPETQDIYPAEEFQEIID